jgi:hypothetical protein
MTGRDDDSDGDSEMNLDTETARALGGYIESLPEAYRPTRDHASRRQRLLPSLKIHAAREHRRVRRRRILVRVAGLTVLGGATAAAALWIGPPSRRSAPVAAHASPASLLVLDGALLLEERGVARTLHAGESVGLADVGALQASSDHPVRVRLSDVVALTLAPSARVRPIATGGRQVDGAEAMPALEVLALERGHVHLEVKKLGNARRFHVVTPDADVEVRGTAFDVTLRPGAAPETCVTVQEGLVLVAGGLKSRLLAPGESWGCDPPHAAEARIDEADETWSPPPVTRRAGTHRAERPARVAAPTHQASVDKSVDPSDLGMQNRLFQTALAAERAGHVDIAVRTYRQLLARAPQGPLAAQARANLRLVSSAPR